MNQRERRVKHFLVSSRPCRSIYGLTSLDGSDAEWNAVRARECYDWLFRYDATTVEI